MRRQRLPATAIRTTRQPPWPTANAGSAGWPWSTTSSQPPGGSSPRHHPSGPTGEAAEGRAAPPARAAVEPARRGSPLGAGGAAPTPRCASRRSGAVGRCRAAASRSDAASRMRMAPCWRPPRDARPGASGPRRHADAGAAAAAPRSAAMSASEARDPPHRRAPAMAGLPTLGATAGADGPHAVGGGGSPRRDAQTCGCFAGGERRGLQPTRPRLAPGTAAPSGAGAGGTATGPRHTRRTARLGPALRARGAVGLPG